MTLGVNWNSTAVQTHQSLRVADRNLSKVLEQLSSGLRINRASDDPSGLVLANALRYQLKGLEQATANAEDGISMVQTADGALDEMMTLLNRAREDALKAANEGINDASQLAALQADLDEVIRSITRIAGDTRFGSQSLLNGSVGGISLDRATRQAFSSVGYDRALLPGGIKAASAVSLSVPAAGITLSREVATAAFSTVASGTPPATLDDALGNLWQDPGGANQSQFTGLPGTWTLTGPKGTQTVPLTATMSLRNLMALINENTGTTGLEAAFSNGALTVASTNFGAGTMTIDSTDLGGGKGLLATNPGAPLSGNAFQTAGVTQTLDMTYVDAQGTTYLVTLTQDPTSEGGRVFRNTTGAPEAVAPFTAYAPGALSVTVKDTTGGVTGATLFIPGTDGGGNPLSYGGSRDSTVRIQTGAQTNQHIAIDIPDLRANALGFGAGLIRQGLGTLQSLSDSGALVTSQAQDALRVIDAAITEVSDARGRLGAIQASGIESTLSSLRGSVENLTSSESQIRDVDFAEQSAQFARYNVLYQAATAMLGQANQVPQTVLQLLRQQ